jgi:exopolysaccharide biosynthesis polyprenyl glycosylphosphotransferase
MHSYLTNPEKQAKLRLLIYDAGLVLGVFLLSYVFRVVFYEGGHLGQIPFRVSWLVILGIGVHLIVFYSFGLYDSKTHTNRKILGINVFLSVILASMGIGLLSFVFPESQIGRILLAIHFVLTASFIFALHATYGPRLLEGEIKDVAVLGWNSLVGKVVREMGNQDGGYRLKTLVISDQEQPPADTKDLPVYMPHNLETALQVPDIETVVLTRELKEKKSLHKALVDLKFQGLEIYDGATFYERVFSRVPVSEISEGWLLFKGQDQPFQPAIYQHGKRIMDVAVSICVLLLSSPLFLLTALLIKLDSRGPVFFRQERLGEFERPFTLMKFRTMVDNAEQKTGPCWAKDNDPRFTRVGKFLRKTRLDEFPQFINVLKGDMSIVGPRPIRQHFAEIFARKFPFYRLRFKVKPGITGWAQVNMNYVNSDEDQYEKLEYEFYYLYHQSLFLDLFIILKTVQSVVRMKGG